MTTVSISYRWLGILLTGLVLLGLLTACGPASAAPVAAPSTSAPSPTPGQAAAPLEATGPEAQAETPAAAPQPAAGQAAQFSSITGQPRTDSQGAVEVEVTPQGDTPTSTLAFDVSMNTHSVDLSMDLAKHAVLRTDKGLEVQASDWPVGTGHHYEGSLSFPAQTATGQNLLEGATKLTLVIKDLDAPERTFEWELGQ